VAAPGEPWDFLGFRYERSVVGLAPVSPPPPAASSRPGPLGCPEPPCGGGKRTGAPPGRTAETFCRRTNPAPVQRAPRTGPSSPGPTWFLPMLDRPDGLRPLDEHVQREARYAATGRPDGPGPASCCPTPHWSRPGTSRSYTPTGPWHGEPGAYDALVARRTDDRLVTPRPHTTPD